MDSEPVATDITCVGVIVEGGLAILALVLGALFGFWPLQTIELRWTAIPEHLAAMVWGAVATLPMLVALWLVETAPGRALRDLRRVVKQQIIPLFSGVSIRGLALISAMAGVGEELLFRGLLQAGLATWLDGVRGPWTAVVVASLAFGLAHCITWSYVVVATLIGAYLGWLFLVSDQLIVPIVAHGLYDFCALLYFVRWARR